jgi:IS4 transposase
VRTWVDSQPITLFFICYGRQSRWYLLLTADSKLSLTQAFELYRIRWNIEVLFKETKQYLGLGSCQSRDFDAQIADCTLAFITYAVLTLHKRFSDCETLGEFFRQTQKDLLALTLWERILPGQTHENQVTSFFKYVIS